jgi:hypothetical protein
MSHAFASLGCRERSDRERIWDEDQARWEKQLRKLAARGCAKDEAPAIVRLAPARTPLELTASVGPRDVLLMPRRLPALTGTEPQDLLCGKCQAILGCGISARAARRRHPEGQRLVLRCVCGALNLLAGDPGRRA